MQSTVILGDWHIQERPREQERYVGCDVTGRPRFRDAGTPCTLEADFIMMPGYLPSEKQLADLGRGLQTLLEVIFGS